MPIVQQPVFARSPLPARVNTQLLEAFAIKAGLLNASMPKGKGPRNGGAEPQRGAKNSAVLLRTRVAGKRV
jgi:hypothetical protein